jgi:DNA transposition AAA+ family ATPase
MEEIRTMIRDFVRTGHTQHDIARQAGISDTTISQFLNDKYAGNKVAVYLKLSAWRDQIEKGGQTFLTIPDGWVETPTGRRIEHALAVAQTEPTIAVVYGNPGLGKTTNIARYQRANLNVWVVTSTPSKSGLQATLQQVAGAVNLRGLPTAPHQLSFDIITRLRGTHGLLIVDEAQHLSVQAFDELRSIFDASGVGLCFCGNEEVYSKVTGRANRAYFAQLASRIGMRLQLRAPTDADVDAFLAPWQITGGAEIEYARHVAAGAGGLRSLYHCLRQAAVAANELGKPIDVKLMRDSRAALGADQ